VLIRRRSLPAIGVAATLATGAAARQSFAAAPDGGLSRLREERRPLPEGLAFQDAEGRESSFAAFRGRGLVVNFWATWCPPCVAEMPALDRAQAILTREGIEVLALSSDRGGRAVVEPFYQRLGLRHLAMWFDARGAAGRLLGIRGLPTTLILDRAGEEVGRLAGEAEWDHPAVLAAVRRLVRGAPAAPAAT
jgi:thiol-disulfide isomerase/thioredoxin